MLKILCAIQSRLDSSRLPRKAMLPLGERAMFYQVYRRIHDEAWFQEDQEHPLFGVQLDTKLIVPRGDFDEYERYIKQYTNKFSLYGGSNENVYDRFVHASVDYDWVVRITADCPLICPDVIDEMLVEFAGMNKDVNDAFEYYSNDTVMSGYPDGLDIEIFTRAALLRCVPEGPGDEEHVTPAMKRQVSMRTKFCPEFMAWPPSLKLSIDTMEDYEFVKPIFESFESDPPRNVKELYTELRRRNFQ